MINSLHGNLKQFQFMVLRRSISDSNVLNIDDIRISSTDEVTLLGATTDNKLTFNNNIDKLCRKASCKLHALCPIRSFLSKEKARLLTDAFIIFQFLCAALIWMFASKSSITKICKIHFRTLQIVYNTHDKWYEKSLAVSNDISVYQKHLHILVIEVYKSFMKTNPDFICDFCTMKPFPYDLRTGQKLYLPKVNKTRYGLNSQFFRNLQSFLQTYFQIFHLCLART